MSLGNILTWRHSWPRVLAFTLTEEAQEAFRLPRNEPPTPQQSQPWVHLNRCLALGPGTRKNVAAMSPRFQMTGLEIRAHSSLDLHDAERVSSKLSKL